MTYTTDTDKPYRPVFSITPTEPATLSNGKPRFLDTGEPEMTDAVLIARLRQMGLHPSHAIVVDLVQEWSPGGKFGISDVYPRHRAAFLRRLQWLLRQTARAAKSAPVAPVNEPKVQAPSTDLSDLLGDDDAMNVTTVTNDAEPEQPTTPFLVSPAPRKTRGSPGVVPFVAPNPAAARK